MKSHHSVDVILNVAQGLLDLKKSGTLPFPLKAVSVPARLPAQRARLRFTLWPMLAMLSMPYNNNNNYTALQYSALLYYPTTLVLVLYIP